MRASRSRAAASSSGTARRKSTSPSACKVRDASPAGRGLELREPVTGVLRPGARRVAGARLLPRLAGARHVAEPRATDADVVERLGRVHALREGREQPLEDLLGLLPALLAELDDRLEVRRVDRRP